MQISGIVFRYGRWFSWAFMVLSIIGVIYWGYGLTTPSEIRIATGKVGSYSHKFGRILKKQIEKKTNYTVKLKESSGSVDNRRLLLSGEADLAILKTGFVSLENLEAVSPLWKNYLHVLVLKNKKISNLQQLKRKSFALGREGSKDRIIAAKLMNYYGVKLEDLDEINANIRRVLRTDEQYLGGITVTNLLDPDFMEQIKSDSYRWLAVPRVDGLPSHFPYFYEDLLPSGAFSTVQGSRPHKSQKTLATTSILAVKAGASEELVESLLPVLNMPDFYEQSPILLGSGWTENLHWKRLPVHPAAKRYFETYSGLEMLSDFVKTANKYKEIVLFTLVFLILVFTEQRRYRKAKKEKTVQYEIKKLENWIVEIVRIEKEFKKVKDIRLLKQYHQEILLTREKALKEIIGKDVQNSSFFQTFLQQCVHVIHEIEFKMSVFADK